MRRPKRRREKHRTRQRNRTRTSVEDGTTNFRLNAVQRTSVQSGTTNLRLKGVLTKRGTRMESFINEAVEQFAHDHTEPESELFRRLREETYRDMNCPQMQVGRIEGRFLKMLVRLTGARRILEIGMFTGYSALMMAEGLPDDGKIITCDVDPKAEAIASRYCFRLDIAGDYLPVVR